MIISAFHPLRTSGWNLVERLHPGGAGLGITYWRLEGNLYAITLHFNPTLALPDPREVLHVSVAESFRLIRAAGNVTMGLL